MSRNWYLSLCKKNLIFFLLVVTCCATKVERGMGLVFQKKQPAGEESGSRSAALGWSWEIFSLGILNVKPSLELESME